MKRFAFLSQVWPDDEKISISGSSVQVYYISKELAKRGYPVLVLLSAHPYYHFNNGNLAVESIGIKKGLRYQINPFWLRKVNKLLKSFEPDIIYQRGKLPETIAAAKYVQKSNAKFIWLSNSDKSPEHWKFVRKRWSKRKLYKYSLLPRLLEAFCSDILIEKSIKRANIVIAQTAFQKKQLKEKFYLDSHILGSGHPIPQYIQKKYSIPKILWLANLTPVKQPQIFAHLVKNLRNLNAEFIMAGDAPDKNILSKIMQICEGVYNFKYLGRVELKDSDELYKNAAVFVSTSIYEGLPNTFIQSFLHSTPVISLHNDPDQIIKENNLGAVASSFEQLEELVKIWIQNKELREKAGKNAYEYAKNNCDIKKTTDSLISLINSEC